MNYLQLDKRTVLKYSHLQSTVTLKSLKSGSGIIQGHWKYIAIRYIG